VANAIMASAVHVVSVQRGIDPRGYALTAFGGAGPMHAARVAERFGIATIIVPAACGVGSAAGLLATDLSTDRVATRLVPHADADPAELESVYAELTAAAAGDLAISLDDPALAVARTVDMRYLGQAHDINVAVPEAELSKADLDELAERFYAQYLAAYGIAPRDPVEFVSYRVRVTRRIEHQDITARPAAEDSRPAGTRRAYFAETGGFTDVPVYTRENRRGLGPVAGPLVVQDAESTVVVPPGWSMAVDLADVITLERSS
jgi:N-methylhydantoinase A